MRVDNLFKFIKLRQGIYELKTKGVSKPWTTDPILQKYRFCNVYREQDKVTQWISRNWREPCKDEPDLWFAMVVARLLNNPPTLEFVGYPHDYENPKWVVRLRQWEQEGNRVFNPAYIVSTNGVAMNKIDYLLGHVLRPLWNSKLRIRPERGDTLEMMHKELMRYIGMGSFLAAQVVADLKFVEPLFHAKDWWTFAASGPGSRRGLNRVLNHFVDSGWHEGTWYNRLMDLQKEINPMMESVKLPKLHAQDLQNCLCEFDKYERVRLGEGRPKQRYDGV